MDSVTAEVRVRYVETDQMGIVHHSVYFHWMEVGRTEFLRAKGYPYTRLESEGIRMMLREARAEYLHPAKYDDDIEVKTTLTDANQVTFSFSYEIRRKADSLLLARGETRHVAAGHDNRPKRIPKDTFVRIGGNIAKQS